MLPFLSSIHGSMVRIVAESAEDLAAVRFDNEEATEWARISAAGAQQLSTDADILSGGISIRQLWLQNAELNSQVAELKSMLLWPMLPPSVLDLTATDSDLRGFSAGFTDGTYGYMATPWSGVVARFSLADFSTVSVLDLTYTDPGLKGFIGGFTDGTYGYLVPGENNGYYGKVARFSLSDFSTVSVLDLTYTDPALEGFRGGFTDGTYGYLVPSRPAYGKVARFSLSDFSTVSVLDLTATDPDLKGFYGGFTDGTYGYLVPHTNGGGVYSGKVARFLLSDFSTVSVLDLTAKDPDLKGFYGGFTDGTYGYLVPHNNGGGVYTGKVARFSLSDFSTLSVLDLTARDPDLRGFVGGFTDGTYGYMVPLVNNGLSGKVARFSLADFSSVSVLDLTYTDSELKGFSGGFTDGTYGYLVPNSGKVPRFSVVNHTQGIGWTSSP